MRCSNNVIQNVSFQMKNIEIQFNNFLVQTQNYGLQNTIYQTQDLGFQMIKVGIQLLNIFVTFSKNMNIFNNMNNLFLERQIQSMINKMQNIKINMKNENEMKMKIPNINNRFESKNPMGNIRKGFNRNISFIDNIKYNVAFLEQTGKRTMLVLDKETTIKKMIELYLNKIDKKLEDIKYKKFIYNGNPIDINSEQTIQEFFGSSISPCIYPTF